MDTSDSSTPAPAGVVNKSSLTILLSFCIAYFIARALYNISPFHPLSHIPGPRIAAMTLLYECWFDLFLGGRYTHEIRRMHEVYGPIVRISPDEVHFNDVSFIDEIYASGNRKRDKPTSFTNALSGSALVSTFGTATHELHRVRRSAASRFFSRAQMAKLEPDIHDLAQRLCDKLLATVSDAPLDVNDAYSCFTADAITSYCFGEPVGFIAQPGWTPNYRSPVQGFLATMFFFRYFPVFRLLVDLAPYLPLWVVNLMPRDIGLLLTQMNVTIPNLVREEMQAGADKDGRGEGEGRRGRKTREGGRSIVFQELLNDPDLPEAEKSEYRLSGEGFSFVGAGTETTAWTLTVLTYHVLSNPQVLTTLLTELQPLTATSTLSQHALEKLPYLTAVLLESLRLSHGISIRLPRVARDETLVYTDAGRGTSYAVPRGATVSMSAALVHLDEGVFGPDAHAFRAERWLDEDGDGDEGMRMKKRRGLERCLLAFFEGGKDVFGDQDYSLVWCELYLATAALVLRVFPKIKLYETAARDVQWDHDMGMPRVWKGSKGVRIVKASEA